jgi:hypothetical protein
LKDDKPNIPLLRTAFELVTDDMNRVINEKFNNAKPMNAVQSLLVRMGLIEPPLKQPDCIKYDNRFWLKQFAEGFIAGTVISRQPGERDSTYLSRYFAHYLHHFAFAPYSYVPGTER